MSRIKLKFSLSKSVALVAFEGPTRRSVWPSAGACTTASVAILVFAPGRFSTMNCSAAGGKAHDQAHRPRRIGLRSCKARDSRQRGSTQGQMQKFPAGKFHRDLPFQASLLDHLVSARE